ncbi:MmpS family transport accessory protein [Streptomyces sp. NPDC052309]|uniref:MmpS family transport accessory protein n=1 Tax=Streptomyces sp. NPDC052309 TaxID=3155421 RepID=UPI00343373D0
MNRISRSIASALVAGGLVLGLGACSDVADEAAEKVEDEVVEEVDKQLKEEYEVTYEVTGAEVDSIEFNAGGGDAANPKLETVKNPTLPWKKTVTLRGIEAPTVLPVALDATGGSAKLTCKIVYKGKTLVEESDAGVVSAAGCVAVSPIAG